MSRIIAAACALVISAPVFAEPIHKGLNDDWQITLAILDQGNDAAVTSTAPGDPPTEIDLDDLGVDDSEITGMIAARWRINDKWSTTFAYSDFSVSGNVVTTQSFNFNGVTYDVDTALNSELELGIIAATVDYAFNRSDTTEWGVGAGIHALDLSTTFQASVGNITGSESDQDFLAPLPNLRGYVRHAFNDKWLLSSSLGWFGATIDDYDGNLIVGIVSVDYRMNDNWSLGLTAQYTDIDLDVDDSRSEDEYDIQLPAVGLTLSYHIR